MIKHMKMMQMLHLDIKSVLVSSQVPTNSTQLFQNGLLQEKKTNRAGLRTNFFYQNPGILFVFLCTPGNSR